MKKERLFYLDFIRAIAAITIVITHYNAIFLYSNPQIEGCYVFDAYVFNIYIGSFGVSLFLIISGAALMYVYEGLLDLKTFYWKRFKTIYPMFWIAYFIAFVYLYLYRGNWSVTDVPKSHLLYSFLGIDGYMAELIPTFYILGEWFLGFIIIFYIIFPLLKWLMEKHSKLLFVLTLCGYIFFQVYDTEPFSSSKIILVRLPELLFGMYFIKKIKKVNYLMALISFIVLLLNTCIKPQFSEDIQTTYVGISAFLLLVFISQYAQKANIVCKICSFVSKYSYAIFLVHHVIIWYTMMKFDLYSISHLESYLIFIGLFVVILLLSKILFEVDKFVEKEAKQLFSYLRIKKVDRKDY